MSNHHQILYFWINIFIVSVYFSFESHCISVTQARYGKAASEKRLEAPIRRSQAGITLSQCASMCQSHSCQAFNFKADPKSFGLCEILNGTQKDYKGTLVLSPKFNYYEVEMMTPNLCDPNPCMYGGKCQSKFTNGKIDFSCSNCPFPMGGPTCADLICTNCTRLKSLVIFLFNNESVHWDVAQKRCLKMGFTGLVTVKDNVTFQFIRDYFYEIYGTSDTSLRHEYWIGLKRKTSSSPFTWTDGTTLGSFQPWAQDRPDSDLCVGMPTTTKFDFYWDDDPCSSPVGNWIYYFICEKNYSFLA